MRQQTFSARLNRIVHQFPNSIQWHSREEEELARIKAKASQHIKNSPAKRASFDCMYRPIFNEVAYVS